MLKLLRWCIRITLAVAFLAFIIDELESEQDLLDLEQNLVEAVLTFGGVGMFFVCIEILATALWDKTGGRAAWVRLRRKLQYRALVNRRGTALRLFVGGTTLPTARDNADCVTYPSSRNHSEAEHHAQEGPTQKQNIHGKKQRQSADRGKTQRDGAVGQADLAHSHGTSTASVHQPKLRRRPGVSEDMSSALRKSALLPSPQSDQPAEIGSAPQVVGATTICCPHDWQAQLEAERDKQMCVACLSNIKSILLLPCRHLCLCPPCAQQFTVDRLHDGLCPLCRTPIGSTTEVFW